ncbi:MAG: J domain-containing protein [Rickettsiales bacterium]|jgi:hypothetical protein|nr:J domain-containing protein [Rickettsiales bacterium]
MWSVPEYLSYFIKALPPEYKKFYDGEIHIVQNIEWQDAVFNINNAADITENAVALIEKYSLLSHNPRRRRQLDFHEIIKLAKYRKKGRYSWKTERTINWDKVMERGLLNDLPRADFAAPVMVPEYKTEDLTYLERKERDIFYKMFYDLTEEEYIAERMKWADISREEYFEQEAESGKNRWRDSLPKFPANIPLEEIAAFSNMPDYAWKRLMERQLLTNPLIFPKGEYDNWSVAWYKHFVMNRRRHKWCGMRGERYTGPSLTYDYWNFIRWLAGMNDKRWAKVEKYRMLELRSDEMAQLFGFSDNTNERILGKSRFVPQDANVWERTRVIPPEFKIKKSGRHKELDAYSFQDGEEREMFRMELFMPEMAQAVKTLWKYDIPLEDVAHDGRKLKSIYYELTKKHHPDHAKPENKATAHEALVEINKAFEVLRRYHSRTK